MRRRGYRGRHGCRSLLVLKLGGAVLLVKFMPGNAAANGAENRVVAGIMTGDTACNGPRHTANGLCLNRCGKGRECTDKEKCAHGKSSCFRPRLSQCVRNRNGSRGAALLLDRHGK